MRVISLAVLVVISIAPGLAYADALGGPPSCEPGFFGSPPRDHRGGSCDPWRCHHDSDCSPRPGVGYAASCQASGLCMAHGRATGTCAHAGDACGDPAEGGRCVAAQLCMPISPAVPPGGPRSALPPNGAMGTALAFAAPILCFGIVFWDRRKKRAR